MNFKRTWLGWANFILSTIFTGAMLIALVFVNLSSGEYIHALKNFPQWSVLTFSILFFAVIVLIGLLSRKLRVYIATKRGCYDCDGLTAIINGAVSLGLFIASIFIRANIALLNTVTPSINSNKVNEFFSNYSNSKISHINDIYDLIFSTVYRFLGMKQEIFVWVNLVFLSLAILIIYAIVRNILGGIAAIVPMAFLCLSPEISSYIKFEPYTIWRLFFFSLLLLIFTGIVSLFKNISYFDIWGHILIISLIFVFVVVLPVILNDGISSYPAFNINSSLKFLRIFLPYSISGLSILILALIVIGSISFIYSETDRLSAISLIFLFSTYFYLYSENNWPPEILMLILFSVYAGLGLDELVFGKVSQEFVNKLTLAKENVVPVSSGKMDITESACESELIESESIEEEDDDVLLTAENTSVKEITTDSSIEEFNNENNSDSEANNQNNSDSESNNENDSDTKISNEESPIIKEVKLLENPLPLPKKRERKPISFKFEPETQLMDFDIEIGDDDDFDL